MHSGWDDSDSSDREILIHEILVVRGKRPHKRLRRERRDNVRHLEPFNSSSGESTASNRNLRDLDERDDTFPTSSKSHGCLNSLVSGKGTHLRTKRENVCTPISYDGLLVKPNGRSKDPEFFKDSPLSITQAAREAGGEQRASKIGPNQSEQTTETGQESTLQSSTTVADSTVTGSGVGTNVASLPCSSVAQPSNQTSEKKIKKKDKVQHNKCKLGLSNGLWSNSTMQTSQSQQQSIMSEVTQSDASKTWMGSYQTGLQPLQEEDSDSESLKSSESSSSPSNSESATFLEDGGEPIAADVVEDPKSTCWKMLCCKEVFNEFDDGINISSDEEVESCEGMYPAELDNEWLRLSNTNLTRKSECRSSEAVVRRIVKRGKMGKSTNRPMSLPVSKALRKYLNATRIINQAMVYLGRNSIDTEELDDGTFEYQLSSSWRTRAFRVTSLFFVIATILMSFNIIRIATISSPVNANEALLILEIEMYWIEALLEILNLFFLSVASVAILKNSGGLFLVDFMNRWTSCLNLLQYDVSQGINHLMVGFVVSYGSYAAVVIGVFIFGGEKLPVARGACGFLGVLLLNSFHVTIRVDWEYRIVEVVGLVLHLYCTLCSGLFIQLITVYCLSLNNAAKRFNERLLMSLNGGGFRATSNSPGVWKVIPYRRIFAEHIVITSFAYQMGRAFHFTFIAYFLTKMVAMITTLMGLAEPTLVGYVKTYNTTVEYQLEPHTVVPVFEPAPIVSGKHFFYVLTTWIPTIVFLEIVLMPGNTIMQGAGIILRKLYIQCKTSHARRFITSMEFSFNSRTIFYINPGMRINREFVAKFVGFTLVTCLGIMQFNPEVTQGVGYTLCDSYGRCTYYRIPPKVQNKGTFGSTIGKEIIKFRHPVTEKPVRKVEIRVFYVPFPAAAGNGRHPFTIYDYAYQCDEQYPVYTPMYFEKEKSLFIQVPPPPPCVNSTFEYFDKTKAHFDSFGFPMNVIKSDECGNPMISTPNKFGERTEPILQVVRMDSRVFCCFKYGSLESQAETCNLVFSNSWSGHCSPKSKVVDRIDWERKITSLWKNNSSYDLERKRDLWTLCLCQGVGDIPVSNTACGLQRVTITTSTPRPTITPTTPRIATTTVCGDMSPTICVNCGNPIPRFNDKFLTTCPIQLTSGHTMITPIAFNPATNVFSFVNRQCGPRFGVLPSLQSNSMYYDCYGNQLHPGKNLDDCGHYPITFPDKVNGSKTNPEMRMERLTFGVFGVVRFICCWDYRQWQHQNVNSMCNMFPGSDVERSCSLRDANSEKEAREVCKKKMFDHQNENHVYKTRCEESRETKNGQVICNNPKLEVTHTPRYLRRLRLKSSFLPCPDLEMHWKAFSSVILKQCTGKGPFQHFPYFDKDLVKTYPPSNRKNCLTKVSTRPSEAFYDCYGFQYEKDELLDDCGSPGLLTPSKDLSASNAFSEPTVPKLHYVKYFRDYYLCCWRFETQTGATKCNLAGSALSACGFRRDTADAKERADRKSPNSLCNEDIIFDDKGVNVNYVSKCPTRVENGPPTVCNNPEVLSNYIELEEHINTL